MKVTMEHEGSTITIDDPDVVDIDDAVDLLQRLLLAIGYHPDTVYGAFGDESFD